MSEIKDYPPYLDYPKPRKRQTNADRIRAMSDGELANLLSRFCHNSDGCKNCPLWDDCPETESMQEWEKWLQQPAE